MNEFESLGKMPSSVFFPFISYIKFPHFKNIEANMRIEFSYPITAIVGPNGTNKSSILRALQGAPDQYNISNYWFETSLDPIDMKENGPQRYYYGYELPSGTTAEVMQVRVYRKDRDDYFETRAPRQGDGMRHMPEGDERKPQDEEYRGGTRWKSINKRVTYIDFREELPAYDIFFNFNWRNGDNDPVKKKHYIRYTSPRVSEALEHLEPSRLWYGRERILQPAIELSDKEVEAISKILGREYKKISLVKHEFFKVEGYTARLATKARKYSEAYAGSGEFAAIMLVHQFTIAPKKSLILLDEPETSLHPRAQRELMRYVAKQCVENKHQVVLSTHAPGIIEELPPQAIKILDIRRDDQHVDILSQSASPIEAFNRLGANYEARTILVEDVLAAELVRSAARELGSDYYKSIHVLPVPGGADGIKTHIIPVEAQTESSNYIILDGDMRPESPLREVPNLSDNELEPELDKIGIKKNHILKNGGNDSNASHAFSDMRKTLNWINSHVRFLPGVDNPDYLLLQICSKDLPSNPKDAKRSWLKITKDDLGLIDDDEPTAQDVFYIQRIALSNAIKQNPLILSIEELKDTLKNLLPPL